MNRTTKENEMKTSISNHPALPRTTDRDALQAMDAIQLHLTREQLVTAYHALRDCPPLGLEDAERAVLHAMGDLLWAADGMGNAEGFLPVDILLDVLAEIPERTTTPALTGIDEYMDHAAAVGEDEAFDNA